MEPQEFLASAKAILDSASHEVDYRNATSRAYYAFFHVCKSIAESTCNASYGSSHEKVINALIEQSNPELRSLGNSLKQIKANRVSADYYLNKTFNRNVALQSISIVHKRIQRLESRDAASGDIN